MRAAAVGVPSTAGTIGAINRTTLLPRGDDLGFYRRHENVAADHGGRVRRESKNNAALHAHDDFIAQHTVFTTIVFITRFIRPDTTVIHRCGIKIESYFFFFPPSYYCNNSSCGVHHCRRNRSSSSAFMTSVKIRSKACVTSSGRKKVRTFGLLFAWPTPARYYIHIIRYIILYRCGCAWRFFFLQRRIAARIKK